MSTPIKSSQLPTSANGATSAANELVARLSAQARGADAQATAPKAFASWMNQHGQEARASGAAEAQPAKAAAAKAPNAQADQASKASAAARANEQAVARARQQALAAQKSALTGEAGRVAEQQAARSRAEQAGQADKTDRGPGKSEQAVRAKPASDKPSEASETTAAAQAAPSQAAIPAGDPASMMAWLAGLQSVAPGPVRTGAEALSEGAQAEAQAGQEDAASLAALGTVEGGQDEAASGAAQGGLVLDNPLWQSAQSTAALQVDALLGKASELGDKPAHGDALSGLMAGGGLRTSGFGPALNQAGAVRHESATLPTPLNSPDFSQALAEKVSMWVSTARTDGPMTAELHLNPAEMGPINVKISLDGQSAQVDFAAAAAETRKAIEASLSVLSSALSDVGLNLTGGDVSSQTAQQSFGQQSAQSEGTRGLSSGGRVSAESDQAADGLSMRQVSAPRPGRPGGLDLYA